MARFETLRSASIVDSCLQAHKTRGYWSKRLEAFGSVWKRTEAPEITTGLFFSAVLAWGLTNHAAHALWLNGINY